MDRDSGDSDGPIREVGSLREAAAGLARLAIALLGAAVVAAAAYVLFVQVPATGVELAGVLLVIVAAVGGLKAAGGIAGRLVPTYDVAEVAVDGPITRQGGRRFPTGPGMTPADDIVDQIESADADRHVEGLLVKLNTPGGEVVPSDDIRRAIDEFDGPTVAYATDVCGSGGYWIASGCDELFARDASLVGSIGVLGSRVTATELADKIGLDYERFAAGRYKDTGVPLREMDDDERAYLQGLIDDFYRQFVERVTEGRDLDAETVRETEARVYLGREAVEIGLADELGTGDDAEDRLAERLDRDRVRVQRFEPERGITERLGGGARAVAYALGAGIARTVGGDGDRELDVRL